MLPLLEAMRPKQWTKNAVIFAALVFDNQLFQVAPFLRTLAGFGLMCLLASTVYLINDLADLDKDRQHPTKRHRPLPSGRLNKNIALAASALLPLLALPLGFLLDWRFGVIGVIYLAKDLAYSLWLKHAVIIDVMLIAAGFLLRVGAGVTLITVERFSPWLYICMGLLALFMGFGKRRAEYTLMQNATSESRKVLREYSLTFLDEMISMVSTATIVAYSLYTFSAPNLPDNHAMMLTIPFVMYAIFRYLYLIHMKGEGGAPDELVLTDRPLQATFVLWGIATMAILYLGRG
jgi:4-hydroxybenzoate polyprenyltransferase